MDNSPNLYLTGNLEAEARPDPPLIRQQTDPEFYQSLSIEPTTPTFRKKLTWHDLNKPLPPVPRFPRSRPQIGGIRLALTAKSTNSKIRKDNGIIDSSQWKDQQYHKLVTTPLSKPVLQISAPVSHMTSNPMSNSETMSTPRMQDSPAPRYTRDTVAELGRKLEALMAKQASSNQTSPEGGVETTDTKGRRITFRRGRKAIDRFKYVLNDRLGGGMKQRGTTKALGFPMRNESWEFVGDAEAEKDGYGEKTKKEAEHRPTEGRSISDSTLKSAGITYMIPRKPVPGGNDERRAKEERDNTNISEDPFADDMEMQDSHQLGFSPLNLDLSLDYRTSHSSAGLPVPQPAYANIGENSPGTSSGFSADVSGVGSQSGLDLSSSSPVGYSTPRIRLEPRVDANGIRRLTSVRSKTASPLGSFDFELDRASNNGSGPRNIKPNEEGISGLKRKNSSRLSGVGISTPPHKKQKKQSLTQGGGKGSFSSHARSDSSLLPKPSNARAKALLRWGKVKGLAVLDSSRS